MRYPDEVYEPISQEDWERGGGPATLDDVTQKWRDEFARQHGGKQPANIGEFRLWFDGLTVEELNERFCRVSGMIPAANVNGEAP
jgi:hypothetical protein